MIAISASDESLTLPASLCVLEEEEGVVKGTAGCGVVSNYMCTDRVTSWVLHGVPYCSALLCKKWPLTRKQDQEPLSRSLCVADDVYRGVLAHTAPRAPYCTASLRAAA